MNVKVEAMSALSQGRRDENNHDYMIVFLTLLIGGTAFLMWIAP